MRSLVLATLVVALAAGIARAEDRATAERYFRAGAKAYSAQNFSAAATNFDEAYKALPMPEIAFSAAQAYRRLYQIEPKPEYVRRSIELYQRYLAAVKTGGRVGDAADNLADMKRELAKLEAAGISTTASGPAQAHTRLGVNVSVPDQAQAELGALREIGEGTGDTVKGLSASIDGTKVEPFALVDVDAKEHVIAVSADGYFPVEKKTVAVAGQSTFVDVELRPKPAKLAIHTEDDARITIDGRFVATAPSAALEVTPGKHFVTVLHRGREPFGKELAVVRGEEMTLAAPLAKTSRRRAVPWVLGGAGVLLAGAAATGLVAVSRDGSAADLRDQIQMGNRPPGDADQYDRLVRSRDRFVTYTWILGGAALATGAVGGFLFYFDTPTADSATVGVTGRF
ncbi:MAG: PEGA domain-containing protein [Kofleriaceae bacterium]|nr:PEGA domain-containing protein [Kofleriaceae bacterium]